MAVIIVNSRTTVKLHMFNNHKGQTSKLVCESCQLDYSFEEGLEDHIIIGWSKIIPLPGDLSVIQMDLAAQ